MKNKKQKHIVKETGIAYKGEVKVQYMVGKKCIKTLGGNNEGEMPLFQFLVSCLAGNYNESSRPYYLKLFKKSGSTYEAVSTTPVKLSSVDTDTGIGTKAAYVMLKFIIPFTILPQGVNANHIAIYSGANKNSTLIAESSAHFALTDNDSDEGIVGDGISNIVITWTMSISNKD